MRRRVVPPQKRLTLPISLPSTSASSPAGLNQEQAGNDGFELKTGLVNMVQASPLCGKASEDANAHLQNFLEVSNTINPRGTTLDDICLRLFPFSLLGKAKTWFYSNKEAFTTWEACSNAFVAKYFPVGKTNALRNKIAGIQQLPDEIILEVWERL